MKRGPNTPEGRARSLSNLKPVKPGERRNPLGRAANAGTSIKEYYNLFHGKSREQIEAILEDQTQPAAKIVAARDWMQAMDKENPNAAANSTDRIFDRTIGKPSQPIEHAGKDGGAIEHALTVEQTINHKIDYDALATDLEQFTRGRIEERATGNG